MAVDMVRWWEKREEVIRWSRRHDGEQSLSDQVENDVGSRLRKTRRLSKADLVRMVSWKFESLPGRKSLVLGYVDPVGEHEISEAFRRALDADSDKTKISELLGLPGIGPAMASVILTFYDPADYAVLDIHAWRELFGKEPQSLFQGPKYLLKFLQKVRLIARMHGLDARTVEKALFQRNVTYRKGMRHT
ncbi:MAG: hypothetical protein WCC94_12585 [Candidatus Bathyarchaeia archaeon]